MGLFLGLELLASVNVGDIGFELKGREFGLHVLVFVLVLQVGYSQVFKFGFEDSNC